MFIRKRHPLEPSGGTETSPQVFYHRRDWLKRAGYFLGGGFLGGVGYLAWQQYQGTDAQVLRRGDPGLAVDSILRRSLPARRDARFDYDRPQTPRAAAARYTNFYEFSEHKWSWRWVDGFQPHPWTLTVDGLCRNPIQLDMDQLHRRYAGGLIERQYRHRCVETWAMAVPWTGIPLALLIKDADPMDNATHVRFVSFHRPDVALNQRNTRDFPWPYQEGLTLAEAVNELTLLATGVYGDPLLKQHGAPLRLVVPWKYGYKSIKSIERIELVNRQPATFWSTVDPLAYPFQSNVDPNVPRPWSQREEWMLGSGQSYPTQYLNGYQAYVGHLYDARS